MGVPRLAYYTIEELAELWGYSVDRIEKYTERGQLNYHSIWYNSYHDGTNMMPGDMHPDGADENNHSAFWILDSIVYTLEEVERFEREEDIKPLGEVSINNKTNDSALQASEPKNVNSFVNTGGLWTVTYDGKTKYLQRNDRIKYIAYLLLIIFQGDLSEYIMYGA